MGNITLLSLRDMDMRRMTSTDKARDDVIVSTRMACIWQKELPRARELTLFTKEYHLNVKLQIPSVECTSVREDDAFTG